MTPQVYTIPLTRGYVATVDAAGYKKASPYKWQAQVNRRTDGSIGNVYAIRTITSDGKRTGQYMHRFLLGVTSLSVQVDHHDGNGLNNTRSNLRVCTVRRNAANQRKQTGTSSQFKGVYWHKAANKWHAQIGQDGKKHNLGYFSDEKDAARAYDAAARERFGEYAQLNLPQEVPNVLAH